MRDPIEARPIPARPSAGRRRPCRGAVPALALCLGVSALLQAEGLAARSWAYEQPPSTISLGLQGGAGLMDGRGSYHWNTDRYGYGDFDWGGALGIRLRYSLDRAHALGISFEDVRFGRKSGLQAPVASQFQVNTFMADYYLYFNRHHKRCPYLVLGVGFHRDAFRLDAQTNVLPPESFAFGLGTGAEYFVRRQFALDLTARGYYLKARGGSAYTGALQLGFQYYLLH